ncbi:MAG TPA: phosphoribosylglycinamide formyltransferase [Longimicrobiales bacterium]|nr:phosphoribosylglycinamide formyltransferase [Longimicrobiales bacterium]
MSVRLAVFASGGGSNLQAILNRFVDAEHVRVALVVSDRAASGALAHAASAGVPAVHIAVGGRAEADVAADTLAALTAHQIDLLALAGYLRLVPPAVVGRYSGRMLNIHPALLPAFGGAGMYGRHVHEAVLAAGCRVTGATVHYVDERYDEGRIVAQWPVPVLPGDTPATLAARVLKVEHRLYPAVIDAIARGVSGERESSAAEAFQLGGDMPPADQQIIAIARI